MLTRIIGWISNTNRDLTWFGLFDIDSYLKRNFKQFGRKLREKERGEREQQKKNRERKREKNCINWFDCLDFSRIVKTCKEIHGQISRQAGRQINK